MSRSNSSRRSRRVEVVVRGGRVELLEVTIVIVEVGVEVTVVV